MALWKYQNEKGGWNSYSTGVPSEINDLEEISEGDEVWVIITGDGRDFIRALMTFDGGSFVISLDNDDDTPPGDIRRSVFPGFP